MIAQTENQGGVLDTNRNEAPSGGADTVKDALLFAKQLADQEIRSIERIHKRTLQYLAYIGIAMAAVAGVFSYIGYSSLRDAAIAAARSDMQNEVTKQVQEKLTAEKIDEIVQGQIKDLSATSLMGEVRKELTSPPLSTSILRVADDEAQQQVKRLYSQRHFSSRQSKILLEQLANLTDLDGYPVGVNPSESNVEAITYASEIRESLSHSKVKLVEWVSFKKPPIEGVGIYYDEKEPDTRARHLQDALLAAGVTSKLVPGPLESGAQVAGHGSPLEVFIGTKPMQ